MSEPMRSANMLVDRTVCAPRNAICNNFMFHVYAPVAFLLLASALVVGQTSRLSAEKTSPAGVTKGKQGAPSQATSIPLPAIDIKVETFRKQIIAGAPIGVVADITNNSNAAVYFREQDVQLLLPPEVEKPGVLAFSSDGWFPTEYLEKERSISLKPKETYRVFWTRTSEAIPPEAGLSTQPTTQVAAKTSAFSAFAKWFQFISFVPGTYPLTVEAKYWDQKKFDGDDYHTVVETKTVEYAAPQRIIFLGAILGGLIFTILSMVRAEQASVSEAPAGRLDVAKAFGKIGLTLLGSVLLSVIITVLVSRIAETQFVVKVTVSDFWGAMAVGFVANYGGWRLLDKMIPATADTSAAQKQAQAKGAAAGAP